MAHKKELRVAILGSVGVPARYGGFETLAEQLVRFHADTDRAETLRVYCSGPAYPDQVAHFGKAELIYSRYRANGASSILYDAATLRHATAHGVDIVLLLGVSGAVALPILKRHGAKVITHVDGQEWRRAKWSAPARAFLRGSERMAVRYSDAIIADSPSIADNLRHDYGIEGQVIAYGGDHATQALTSPPPEGLPEEYTLALCRIEPENNVHMILEASAATRTPLVFVGNWDNSAYGRDLRARFGSVDHMRLLDPIYAAGPLYALRQGARRYVHGHSAGGTNPALVEMMHFSAPIMAFDCVFNRDTTHGQARYFQNAQELAALLSAPHEAPATTLQEIARAHYTWDKVGTAYFDLFNQIAARP